MNPVQGRFRVGMAVTLISIHLAAVYGMWWCITWGVSVAAWGLAMLLYLVSSLGITVGYHRYFTHQTFQCHEWVKYALASAGALAAEGPLSEWCSNHRQHHAYTDDEYDPHSPWQYKRLVFPLNHLVGFLWAHMGWIFWETNRPQGYNPKELPHDAKVISWQERYYWHITVMGFLVPFVLAGWSGLFLAGFIRTVAHLHVTWMINSVCHVWGTRPLGPDGEIWKKDKSRNNVFVAFLSMGEGYHGNHHVHQKSAQLGFRWYHWDPGKWLIHGLELFRCVWDVHRYRPAA